MFYFTCNIFQRSSKIFWLKDKKMFVPNKCMVTKVSNSGRSPRNLWRSASVKWYQNLSWSRVSLHECEGSLCFFKNCAQSWSLSIGSPPFSTISGTNFFLWVSAKVLPTPSTSHFPSSVQDQYQTRDQIINISLCKSRDVRIASVWCQNWNAQLLSFSEFITEAICAFIAQKWKFRFWKNTFGLRRLPNTKALSYWESLHNVQWILKIKCKVKQ